MYESYGGTAARSTACTRGHVTVGHMESQPRGCRPMRPGACLFSLSATGDRSSAATAKTAAEAEAVAAALGCYGVTRTSCDSGLVSAFRAQLRGGVFDFFAVAADSDSVRRHPPGCASVLCVCSRSWRPAGHWDHVTFQLLHPMAVAFLILECGVVPSVSRPSMRILRRRAIDSATKCIIAALLQST